MTIWAKIRERSQLGTDQVVYPAQPFLFPSIPATGSIVEITLSANETLYRTVTKPYVISKRILPDVRDPRGECFNPSEWHLHLILSALHSDPIYKQLFLDCKIDFSDAFERRKFGEYGAATLILNGVKLGTVILPILPADPNDIVYFDQSYYAFEKTTFKADQVVHVEIGNLLSYHEVFDQAILQDGDL